MPRKIYLFCSAEDYGRPCHRFRGLTDPPLTEYGKKQVERLAGRIAPVNIGVVYTSPQRRAVAVADAVAAVGQTDGKKRIEISSELIGRSLGRFEWRPFGEAVSPLTESDITDIKLPDGESYAALAERVELFLQKLRCEKEQAVGIVADEEVIRQLLLYHGCITEKVRLASCSVSTLEYYDGRLVSVDIGDDRHITDDIITPCSPPHLSYRAAETTEELRLAAEFWRSSWYAVYGNLDRFSFYGAQAEIQRIYEENSGAVILAMLGNTSIGTAVLDTANRQEPGCGHITLFVLGEQFRGLGLAPQLMGEAEDFYRKLGREQLRLYVSATNERAIAFYKKNGFDITSAEATVRDCTYIMRRPVTRLVP